MAIFDPHRIHTPWPITKKFVASDYVGDPYGCAKFGANTSTGGFWANGWNITKINTKNCSLSIVLTATDQKPQESLKRWYYPPYSHCLDVNVMLSRPNMTFLMIFCGFWSVDVNSMDKLQFLALIFAVLLSKLRNVPLCNYTVYLNSFSIR